MFENCDINQMSFLIPSGIGAFLLAYTNGSNDAANSIGSIVGSGMLQMRTAIVLCAVLEFIGAVCFGNSVAQTIGKGIVDTDEMDAHTIEVGFSSVLIGTAVWIGIATVLRMPVSITHGVVGSVLIWGINVSNGYSVVNGTKLIVLLVSWTLSPALSGLMAAGVLWMVQKYLLDPQAKGVKRLFPIIVGCVVAVALEILAFKGFPALKSWSKSNVLPVVLGTIALGGLSSGLAWLGRGRVAQWVDRLSLNQESSDENDIESPTALCCEGAEKYFVPLTVLSGCTLAFAHGGNDVGNALGPLSMVYESVTGESEQPYWVVVCAAASFSLGILTTGFIVVRTIANDIVPLKPHMAFVIQMVATLLIVVATLLGIPVSTSHMLVGAMGGTTLFVGHEFDTRLIRRIILSWVITIPMSGAFTLLVQTFLDTV